MSHEPNVNVGGESDGRVLPTKCPNKDGKPSAEGREERRPTKENTGQATASQMQSWVNALDGLRRVREAAKRDKRLRFTALLHHVSVALLSNSFYALKREAAASGTPGASRSCAQRTNLCPFQTAWTIRSLPPPTSIL
jgi:RNA-directed DNA polymerase